MRCTENTAIYIITYNKYLKKSQPSPCSDLVLIKARKFKKCKIIKLAISHVGVVVLCHVDYLQGNG